MLTVQECKAYLSKLDIIATGTKVGDLRSALSESYSQGRDLLNASSGMLLIRQRIFLYKQLKKLGPYRNLSLSRLRYYAKRLGVCKCDKMRKCAIISALNKFETSHCAGMFNTNNTHTANVLPVLHERRQKHDSKVPIKPVHAIAVRRKRRQTHFANVCDDIRTHRVQTVIYKGLVNLTNTCYFNSVIQCLLHCPLARESIENVSQNASSIHVLREIHILFNRMSNNDASAYVCPSECFEAVMNTPECKAVQLSLNNRQEDVHEFFLRLLEHLDEELTIIADTFSLPNIFNIHLRSTITCQNCQRSADASEWLWVLSLYFPLDFNEDASRAVSHSFDIHSLMDIYFSVENLLQHPCSQCRHVGGTEKKLMIINAPQILVVHLSRFTVAIQKIHTFVEFPAELSTAHIRDGHGQQMTYRLTGVITHTGSSIANGHYIAYVQISGKWYEANDTFIRELSWDTVRALQVYVLFYERV